MKNKVIGAATCRRKPFDFGSVNRELDRFLGSPPRTDLVSADAPR